MSNHEPLGFAFSHSDDAAEFFVVRKILAKQRPEYWINVLLKCHAYSV